MNQVKDMKMHLLNKRIKTAWHYTGIPTRLPRLKNVKWIKYNCTILSFITRYSDTRACACLYGLKILWWPPGPSTTDHVRICHGCSVAGSACTDSVSASVQNIVQQMNRYPPLYESECAVYVYVNVCVYVCVQVWGGVRGCTLNSPCFYFPTWNLWLTRNLTDWMSCCLRVDAHILENIATWDSITC